MIDLSRFPRVSLGHLPTPLEPLPRLTKLLGGPEVWIKRDDCTGLASGGNKTRKLEFLMGEAQSKGADTVIVSVRVWIALFVTMSARWTWSAASAGPSGPILQAKLDTRINLVVFALM